MPAYLFLDAHRVRMINLLNDQFDLEGFQTFVLKMGGRDALDELKGGIKDALVTSFITRREKNDGFDAAFFAAWRDCAPARFRAEISRLEGEILMRSDVESTKDLSGQPKVVGDPDMVRLICKVSAPTFTKSTKAIEMPGGCLVQVSTKERNVDGSFSVAEAMSFVPGVRLAMSDDGKHWRFVADGGE